MKPYLKKSREKAFYKKRKKNKASASIYFNLHDGIVSSAEGGVPALPDVVASDTSTTRAAPSLNYTLQQLPFVANKKNKLCFGITNERL